jgi:hypothetical protein
MQQERTDGSFTLAQGERDGKPWFAIIREKFKQNPEKIDLPWLLSLKIKAEVDDQGLVSDVEAEILNKQEDNIEEFISASGKINFVARITWNGMRSVFYYISDPKIAAEKLNQIIEDKLYSREFEYKIERDPNWEKMSETIPNIEDF